MGIFEYIRNDNERLAKLFGFTIMEQTSDYMTAERHQSFLGGLITTIKVNDPYAMRSNKDIKFLGYSIIKRIEENNYRNYYFLNIKYRSISLINEFKKHNFKYFDKKYDDIYILRANSGEIYLTLTYVIRNFIRKNKSKNPLLLATQKYHIDMIKMICPDIPYIYIGKLDLRFSEDIFKIDNFRFFLLFSHPHFKQVEMDIKTHPLGESHYFKSILNRLKISEQDLEMNRANVLPEAEKSMLEKINKTGLNLSNFVFLTPEAQSCKLYDDDFWCELINRFQKKGYDVFVNLVDDDIKLKSATNYKVCDLTFAEAFALAKKAKKIVSLRSGFTEFLLQTGVPIDVLYTKFRHRDYLNDMDVYQVMSGFGLIRLPYIDKAKIKEFNMFETSPKQCLEEILETNYIDVTPTGGTNV